MDSQGDGSLTPSGYMPRVVDSLVSASLEANPIVVVEGAKGCGKTWTGMHHAQSQVLLADTPGARMQAETLPRRVLDGPRPRLVDEWAMVPSVWDAAKHVVDEGRDNGCFILTGSSRPADDITRHSGAGRVGRIRMRPMSLVESGESTGEVSLGSLFDGDPCDTGEPAVSIPDLAESLCRGGWPRNLGRSTFAAQEHLDGYLDEMARVEVPGNRTRHDPRRVHRLLTSLARNVSTPASLSTLATDVAGEPPLSWPTTASYMDELERLFLVEDLPAWVTRIRSKAKLRKAPKRHFVDPSLAAALLGADPDRLLDDLETMGLLFESLVIRDLRVYAAANRAEVYHYKNSYEHELDAVVERRDGRWIAIEVKLGLSQVEEAADSLAQACRSIDAGKRGRPAKKLAITGHGYSYERDDGVSVVPITALGP